MSVNSHGFMIDLSGLDMERFKKNPVMLYGHDRTNVIGRWENVRVEDNQLKADAVFDEKDPFGKEVARKVNDGFIKACSVGIYIRKMKEDEQENFVAKESELIEASIVPIPSDPDAITLYDERGDVTTLEAVMLNFDNTTKKNSKMSKIFNLTAATLLALCLDAEATELQVEKAVLKKDERIAELEREIAEMKKARINELVENAIAEKKIGADDRETYTSLAEKDLEGVEKILSKMKGVPRISSQLSEQSSSSKYAGKSWDELDKANLLSSLKAEDPEGYARLYREKFHV